VLVAKRPDQDRRLTPLLCAVCQAHPGGAQEAADSIRDSMLSYLFQLEAHSLIYFYGVGIIATNTRFSPTFLRYFFWIAIFWSLISSTLLSCLTVAYGALGRDTVGVFLTGLGIWLVVIQIGQTHAWSVRKYQWPNECLSYYIANVHCF
jgi:hypothetical protein